METQHPRMKQNKLDKADMTNRILFILSLLGACIALYVTQSFLRHSSILCVNGGCEAVRKNTASYLLGIPVPAYGLMGYALLTTLTFLRTTSSLLKRQLFPYIRGIATGGVAFVAWFTYTELFVIHAICTWCALSAVIMTTICILTWNRSNTTKEVA